MLEVKDLAVSYGHVRAVRSVSFRAEKGSVVTLIGSNGAGKSTTINAIHGLVRPQGGSVLFEGQDITGWPAHRVSALGIAQVPEGRLVIAPLTVEENLLMGAYLRRDKGVRGDLEGVYDRFGVLRERRGQYAGSLSGGEQEMLAIGRALMARPKMILMDEPSMGLAPMIVNLVFGIIKSLAAEGNTIVLVEQNAAVALAVVKYGYVIERGRVVDEGEPEALRHNPRVQAAYLG